jgi:hypothetical protein
VPILESGEIGASAVLVILDGLLSEVLEKLRAAFPTDVITGKKAR